MILTILEAKNGNFILGYFLPGIKDYFLYILKYLTLWYFCNFYMKNKKRKIHN